jgi:predicted secreted Zn-dependent protease
MGVGGRLGWFAAAIAAAVISVGPAGAAAKVSVRTEHYRISGKSGVALLDQMDRKGPKHGFMSRAIAQTRYSMNSSADWRWSNGVCRARDVSVELSITYVYPHPAGAVPAELKRRWGKFMRGVVAHEEMHGKIAKQMAVAASRTIEKLAVRDGRNCSRVQGEMKRKVNGVVAQYEARQEQFDDREHREGGNIDRLVRSLAIGRR